MIEKISFGEYIVGRGFLYGLNPMVKLLASVFYVMVLFFLRNIFSYFFVFLVIFFTYLKCEIKLSTMFFNIFSIVPILVITSILNLFFSKEGKVVFKFFSLSVTKEAIYFTVLIVFRLILLIIGLALLTYSTSPMDLTYAIGGFLKPLKVFHFPVSEVCVMLSLALRFIPTLVEETSRLICVQKARGANFKSKNVKDILGSVVSVLVPLMVNLFKRSDALAIAMESRLYRVGVKRTSYRFIKFGILDLIFLVAFGILFSGLIFLDVFLLNGR